MKLKEIHGTSNIAWSPASLHCPYLACGTTAQQVDATFSTSASLEIHALDFAHHAPTIKGSISTNQRFYKVVWGAYSMTSGEVGDLPGVIVGGTDGGTFNIYNPNKILKSQGDALISTQTKHSGPVRSLDFNSFQSNLLATGASDSGILIWDLKKFGTPLPSGPLSQPLEEITSLAWNKKVPYILASSFPSRCVMWDLRKYETIMKVSDSSSRVKCKMVAWHPEIATQLCLASEDDHCPIIQLWDLRFATSPLKTMEYHKMGVLSIAWCTQDPDLLLSCGKDNLIICWNPNSSHSGAEVLAEFHLDTHWNFDLQWCPRNPEIIAASSFDGKVGVYSLFGNETQVQRLPNVGPEEAAHHHSSTTNGTFSLKKAPKWLKRPNGSSFGFGGKIVMFAKSEGNKVLINQTVTEPEILKKAEALDKALKLRDLETFCNNKINSPSFPNLNLAWAFIKAGLEKSPKTSRLKLLGFDPDLSFETPMQDLSLFDGHNKSGSESADSSKTKGNHSVVHSLLVGNIAQAVHLCAKEGAWPEALILSQKGGPDLFNQTQKNYLSKNLSPYSRLIFAIVSSDWSQVLEETTKENWKEVLAALLTHTTDENFISCCNALGEKLEHLDLHFESMLCYICTTNLELLSKNWIKCYSSLTYDLLQELIEQIMILRNSSYNSEILGTTFSSLLQQYIELLCSQGALYIASTYLMSFDLPSLVILKERILVSLGMEDQVNSTNTSHYDKPLDTHIFPPSQVTSDLSTPAIPNYQNDHSPNPYQLFENKQLQIGKSEFPQSSLVFQTKENTLTSFPSFSQQNFNSSTASQTKSITSIPHYNFTSNPNVTIQTSKMTFSQSSPSSYASNLSTPQSNTYKPFLSGNVQNQENLSMKMPTYFNANPHQLASSIAPPLSTIPPPINSLSHSPAISTPLVVPTFSSAISPSISKMHSISSNLPPPPSSLPPPPSSMPYSSSNLLPPQTSTFSHPSSYIPPPPTSTLPHPPSYISPPPTSASPSNLPPTSTLPCPPSNLPPSSLSPLPSALPSSSNFSYPGASVASSRPSFQQSPYLPSTPSHSPLGPIAPTFTTFAGTSLTRPNYDPSPKKFESNPLPPPSFGSTDQFNSWNQGSADTTLGHQNYQMQPPSSFLPTPPQNKLGGSQLAIPPPTASPSFQSFQVKPPPTSLFTPISNHTAPPLSPALPTNIQSGWNDPPPIQTSTHTGMGLPRGRPRTSSYGTSNVGQTTHYGSFPPYNSHQFMPPSNTGIPTEFPLPSQDLSNEIKAGGFNFYDPTVHQNDQTRFENEKIGDSVQPQTKNMVRELSPENSALCNTLEELRERCLSIATNPQHIRKLEELTRKLENLNSKLREDSLPPDVLNGLQQIGAAIRASDFQAGINIHNNLVSGANFSEISSFMPGIKSLIQTALVLHVQL